MRLLVLLVLFAAPVAAQSRLESQDGLRSADPNAEVAQRQLGPNAQAAQRPATGPNTELARTDRLVSEAYYPTCAAAGAVRTLPVRRGEPGYNRRLDRDDDGVACEQEQRAPSSPQQPNGD